MEYFHIYKKKPAGKSEPGITIAELIPEGRENAISRERLVQRCVELDLIDFDVKFKDRAMRKLIEKARVDYVILARCGEENGGYYIPTREDMLDLQRYIRQEEKKAKSIFRNLKRARALYEDFKYGRIGADT